MNIAIDCRYLGKSGIGRVCQGILDNLDYSADTFYLIGKPDKLVKYDRAVIIEDYTEPYSAGGLLKFNKREINKKCNGIIIPNFLIPFGIKIPIYSVMHDLIFLDVKETVNGKIDYAIKKYLLKRCMKRSRTIACVSGFTKSRCEYHFRKYADKCFVNYNGISNDIIEYSKSHFPTKKVNTIVFVGNVKRHKGLHTLLEAFSLVNDETMILKIIGEREGFITGLRLDESAYKNVVFTGRLDDEELYSEIQKAKYLVQPSVYEGFGLPPLEALCLGTQPIISDIEVFREIYRDLPVKFFKSAEELAAEIQSEADIVNIDREDIVKQFNFKKFSKKIMESIY